MIRRSITTADGRPHWALISQVEHARIAGELAAHWGAPPFEPLAPRDEMLAAIFHHDDGWADWERSPEVDPRQGRPLEFTEMPLGQSLAIWQRSIDGARQLGDLAPWLVSGHFSALLRRANAWQPARPPEAPEARDFLQRQDAERAGWLAAWQARDPGRHTAAAAELGLRYLQFFDALSLWLCCAERREAQTFDVPSGPPLELLPSAGEIAARPWPWTVAELRVQTAARVIAVASYPTAAALAAAPSAQMTLAWRWLRSP